MNLCNIHDIARNPVVLCFNEIAGYSGHTHTHTRRQKKTVGRDFKNNLSGKICSPGER